MTDRRSRQSSGDSLGYNRMSERFEASNAAMIKRFEGLIDHVDSKLGRIDRDLARGEQDTQALKTAISELRRDMGELRETISLHDSSATRQAAEGAAAGAAKVALDVAAKSSTARRPSLTTLFTMLFLALGGALSWGPKLLSLISQALHLTGRGSD